MQKSLKIAITAISIVVSNPGLRAQGVVVTSDPQDIHYAGKTYNGIKGNAYLYDNWAEGTVKLTDGTVYEGLKLKYDQLKDEVYFKLEDNRAKTFRYPVKQFTIQNPTDNESNNKRVFINGFSPIDGASEKSFYEILHEGDLTLLKRTSKSIVEERAEGQTYKTKQIKAIDKYYLANGDKLTRIKKDKKSILAALPDRNKALQLESYLTEKKVNFKEDKGLAQLVVYYNSL